jgi:hypothetical protein
MIVLPIPLNIPPEDGACVCCIGGRCGGGCIGLELDDELLGGGDLDPPLEPPLAILYLLILIIIYFLLMI